MDAHSEKTVIRLLCCALPFSVLNITMFNVALPEIAGEFRVSPSAAAWVVTGFAPLYSVGSLLYGKLADIYPVRRLLMAAIAIFGCGSLLGLFAFNFPMLLAGRFVQTVGASCFPAMAMQVPSRFVKEERRGQALGVVSATLAVAGGFGPILGGWIAEWFHWRSLFLISIGVVLTLPFIHRHFPRETGKNGGGIDLAGAGLFGLSAILFMLSVTQADARLAAAGFALLAAFLFQQRKAAQPFVPPALFRNRRYSKGLIMGSLSSSTNISVTLLTPLALHHVYGFHSGLIGLIMFPGAMSAALLGKFGGKLADRKGSRFVMALAAALTAAGLLALSASLGAWPWLLAACLILANCGSNFMQTTLAKRISVGLAPEHVGIGMGVFGLTNFLTVGMFGTVVTKAAEWPAFAALNPIHPHGQLAVFGGIYLALCVLPLCTAGLIWGDRPAKKTLGNKEVMER